MLKDSQAARFNLPRSDRTPHFNCFLVVFPVCRLVYCEAIEITVAAGAYQIFLAAPSGAVGAVPGGWILPTAGAIEMANMGSARTTAAPVTAAVVGAIFHVATIDS